MPVFSSDVNSPKNIMAQCIKCQENKDRGKEHLMGNHAQNLSVKAPDTFLSYTQSVMNTGSFSE